ncbi:hypothetical protein EMMF5_004490 [Cystobasidiomycetes sp. EMM_F5]
MAVTPVASTSRRQFSLLSQEPRRTFSSSSRSRFLPLFGISNRGTSFQKYAQDFRIAIEEEDPDSLATAFSKLSQELKTNPDGIGTAKQVLPASLLSESLQLLSKSAYVHADFKLLMSIFHDMASVFGYEWSAEDHRIFLLALCEKAYFAFADAWLRYMETGDVGKLASFATSKPASISRMVTLVKTLQMRPPRPRTEDCLLFYRARQTRPKACLSYSQLDKTMSGRMSEEQCSDMRTVRFLMTSLLGAPLQTDFREVLARLRQMLKGVSEIEHINVLSDILASLVPSLYNNEASAEAKSVKAEFDQLVENGRVLPVDAWNAIFRYIGATGSFENLLKIVKDARARGAELDSSTIPVLLDSFFPTHGQISTGVISSSQIINVLSHCEQATGALCDESVIDAAITRSEFFEQAEALYTNATRDGLSTTSIMIRRLANLANGQPEQYKIVRDAYKKLVETDSERFRSPNGIHDMGLYADLLSYCARPDVADVAWTISLLDDMRHCGLCFDYTNSTTSTSLLLAEGSTAEVRQSARPGVVAGSSTPPADAFSAAQLVIRLMRNIAKNHTDAFKIYAWTLALDANEIFNEKDFSDIIYTFASLDFAQPNEAPRKPGSGKAARASFCPLSVYLAFFEDMQKAGLHPTCLIYSSVLHYYAREGSAHSGAGAEIVRQIHDRIKMDHFIDPDIGLMNRLMFAYCRTGDIESARGVWRTIVLNRFKFNNISVSIALDVMGLSRQSISVASLWSNLKKVNFRLNTKNLQSYVEALCRVGRLDEAENAVFSQAGDIDGIPVDAQVVEVLLKFARHQAHPAAFQALRDRVQAEYPDIWPAVKRIGTSAISREQEARVAAGMTVSTDAADSVNVAGNAPTVRTGASIRALFSS